MSVRQSAILLSLALLGACRTNAGTSTDGTELFNQNCARCHGKDGVGDPVAKVRLHPPDMTDPAFQDKLTDDQIKNQVIHGSKNMNMPAFGPKFFTDQQLDALVKHVRSFRRK